MENLAPWHDYEYTTPESIYNHPSGLVEDVTLKLTTAYYDAIKRYNKLPDLNKNSKVKVVYTGIELHLYINSLKLLGINLFCVYVAMHGVGYQWAFKAFDLYQHHNVQVVPLQQFPDPEFPTVLFPNPEEKGVCESRFTIFSLYYSGIILVCVLFDRH